MSGPAKDFHAHLDVCRQCERHPFNLCPIGSRLINEAATRLGSAFIYNTFDSARSPLSNTEPDK